MGFGFGAIQSGLFLYEAYRSGNFSRFVVAEIDQVLVDGVRNSDRKYRINIARKDRIDQCELEGIEICNPRDREDRESLIDAVSVSDELATALPSVGFYDTGGDTSVARILSEGLSRRTETFPTVIYASENHNHAAEILTGCIRKHTSPDKLEAVQVLNTVIGKMSGVISEREVIERMGLATITPDIPRAVLVEEFNRILISRVNLEEYRRGIGVFLEKDDLLPFEEAKLYGHNAIHALIAYLADLKGIETVAQAGQDERIMQIARDAFINESGAALIQRHCELRDPLFTQEGYREYAEDLLQRMISPFLNDMVWRVGRDHLRKLGYDDRLFGTMGIALQQRIKPVNLALGSAAGVHSMIRRQHELPEPVANLPASPSELSREMLRDVLLGLWGNRTDEHCEQLIDLTWSAMRQLRGE